MGATAVDQVASLQPVVFRAAPAARRCGLYLPAGVAAVAALWAFLYAPGMRNDLRATVALGIVFGLPAMAIAVLFQRCRIGCDDAGVWQRYLFRWDLWPWEAFADGRIRPGPFPLSVEFPTRSWPYRRLVLQVLLTESDRNTLGERVSMVLPPDPTGQLPPPPDLPETVTVRCEFGKRLEMSKGGMRVVGGGVDEGKTYAWSSVPQVRVLRPHHSCRGFSELEVELPQPISPISLRVVNGRRGPTAEVVVHYIERHLPPERFVVTATNGPPLDLAEADRMLARLDRLERGMRRGWGLRLWSLACCGVPFYGVLLDGRLPVPHDPFQWIALCIALLGAALWAAVPWLFVGEFRQRIRRRREELARWRADQAPPS